MKRLNKRAISVVEYTVLFVIIVGAIIVMRTYIQRGLYATWGASGQAFSWGRQYDAQRSIACSFDAQSNLWYDRNCFESLSNATCGFGDTVCQESIITQGKCNASSCSQLNN